MFKHLGLINFGVFPLAMGKSFADSFRMTNITDRITKISPGKPNRCYLLSLLLAMSAFNIWFCFIIAVRTIHDVRI